MHLPTIFLFNAGILITLISIVHAVMAYNFWMDIRNKSKPSRVSRAIAIYFTVWSCASGWSGVYTFYSLFGNDDTIVLIIVLFIRDIVLTMLLASLLYLYMELLHGNDG